LALGFNQLRFANYELRIGFFYEQLTHQSVACPSTKALGASYALVVGQANGQFFRAIILTFRLECGILGWFGM